MKDWLMELCPEMAEWQVDLIVDHVERLVRHERDWVIDLLNTKYRHTSPQIVEDIRARGEKQ